MTTSSDSILEPMKTVPDYLLADLAIAASRVQVIPGLFQSTTVGCVSLVLHPTHARSGRPAIRGQIHMGSLGRDIESVEFSLFTEDGVEVLTGDVGHRGTFLISFEPESARKSYRLRFSLAEAITSPAIEPVSAWSCYVPAGAAAKTSDEPTERHRAELYGDMVYLNCEPEEAPLGGVLVWVTQDDVPVGPRELVPMPIGGSPRSGEHRSGEIAVSKLLPPGTTYNGDLHQVSLLPVTERNLNLLTPTQREMVASWKRRPADDRMSRRDHPAVGRQLSAKSADDPDDDND